MKAKQKTTPNISEIRVQSKTDRKVAALSCAMPREATLSILLYDKFSVLCHKETFMVKAGENELFFDCSGFQGGHYSAWIELEGSTYLRSFYIQEKKDTSILGKFRKLFQPRQMDEVFY